MTHRWKEPQVSANVETGVWTADGSDLLSQPLINFLARRRIAISLAGFIGLLLINLLIFRTIPLNPFDFSNAYSLLASVLLLGGLAIRSWSAGTLNKSREVTDDGPYALTRNPLYIGSFMMMIAFAIWLRDLPTFLFILGPMSLLYRTQVLFEEKRLSFLFGDAWTAYAKRVPRFIPRHFPPAEAFQGWTLFEWRRNREYRAILATAIGVLGIYAWHMLAPGIWAN